MSASNGLGIVGWQPGLNGDSSSQGHVSTMPLIQYNSDFSEFSNNTITITKSVTFAKLVMSFGSSEPGYGSIGRYIRILKNGSEWYKIDDSLSTYGKKTVSNVSVSAGDVLTVQTYSSRPGDRNYYIVRPYIGLGLTDFLTIDYPGNYSASYYLKFYDYLQSSFASDLSNSGTSPILDSGVLDNDKLRLVACVSTGTESSDKTNNNQVLPASNSGNRGRFGNDSSGKLYYGGGNSNYSSSTVATDGTPYIFDLSYTKQTASSTDGTVLKSSTNTTKVVSDETGPLFGAKEGTYISGGKGELGKGAIMRFYGIKFYLDDDLVGYFIPAGTKDGKFYGMYDKINHKLHTSITVNRGFTAGQEIHPEDMPTLFRRHLIAS